MPASSRPTPDTSPERQSMPNPVRLAIGVLAVLAVLLLLYAVVAWLGRQTLAQQLVEQSGAGTLADAERFVLIRTAPFLFLGVAAVTAAIGLARRRPWARFVGLATTAALALLTLMNALAVGGLTGTSLFVLVLAVAGVVSLLARSCAEWLRRDPPR